MTGWLGISLGDITGIGPEVTLKAVAAELPLDDTRYLLIGDASLLRGLNECLRTGLDLVDFSGYAQRSRVAIANSLEPLPAGLACGSPAAAGAALAWLQDGAERCLRRELDALVTAPVNKEAILHTGRPFIGQTEFLSELAAARDTAMMLLGHDRDGRWLRVALASTHLPLKLVASQLTTEKVFEVIARAHQACRDLGLVRSRVVVCGLNPHAGEGGTLGSEEIEIILPAVRAAQEKGLSVEGPLSADTVFYRAFRGDFDAVVAMYHDQGLVPLKMVAFDTGVNWTLGLPFIRTSPDHGTAYDIAGQGIANPSSMSAALHLARQLIGQAQAK
jgi:4-hydroxythreonine-4-phosphate dehydrogenase